MRSKNGRLMIVLIIFVVVVGFLILIANINKPKLKVDENGKAEDFSNTVVDSIGLPDGEIDINNDTIQALFNYFKEDKNCLHDNVNNINGSNKSKLLLTYNYLLSNNDVISCSNVNNLVISDKYFCSNTNSIDKKLYNNGINSSVFLNYLKSNDTYILDGSLMNDTIQSMFGDGIGYIKESFLFGNDSYIYYDSANNKYIMYKYITNNKCNNYDEELISAKSSEGVLEIYSKLTLSDSLVNNLTKKFKYDMDTGNYYFYERISS